MKVSYSVEVEEIKKAFSGRESEESRMIREFLDGTQPNMCFEYETDDEAKQKAGLVSQIAKRINESGKKIDYTKRNKKIYILRASA